MSSHTGVQPEYLSLAQAATVTGLSKRTLRRAIAAERLRCCYVGRLVRIGTAELRRWIESNGAAPEAGAR
jgi:excisionase family DNA binding protein